MSIVDNPEPTAEEIQLLRVSIYYISHLKPDQYSLCPICPSDPGFTFLNNPETILMVIVCVGSGIVPFRAFVQERACRTGQGKKFAPALLFIGCKSPKDDRIYGSELD
ncbi:hypothetical protein BDW75DRAFT_88236 [Aspergillus navahoensis]